MQLWAHEKQPTGRPKNILLFSTTVLLFNLHNVLLDQGSAQYISLRGDGTGKTLTQLETSARQRERQNVESIFLK